MSAGNRERCGVDGSGLRVGQLKSSLNVQTRLLTGTYKQKRMKMPVDTSVLIGSRRFQEISATPAESVPSTLYWVRGFKDTAVFA